MSNRYRSLILPALLSAGALAIAGVGALAKTLPPPDLASAEGNVRAVALIQRPQKPLAPAIVWDQQKHGERCLYREGACRLFYDGYYYETPWWGLPLAIGGGIGAVDY